MVLVSELLLMLPPLLPRVLLHSTLLPPLSSLSHSGGDGS